MATETVMSGQVPVILQADDGGYWVLVKDSSCTLSSQQQTGAGAALQQTGAVLALGLAGPGQKNPLGAIATVGSGLGLLLIGLI